MGRTRTIHLAHREAAFPCVLKFANFRLYAFVTLFVAMDVAIPWLCHCIHPLAGPTFLPMFFFILLAGLLFGWRAGIMVGILTPLVSYGFSGMPFLERLPTIVIEASFYGLSAGLFRERFKLNVFWSLLGAMVVGRLAAALALLIMHWSGDSNSPVLVWQAIKQGWPGIAIQLVFLPTISIVLEKISSTSGHHE
ncbi:MAG: ECF transporter S component [Syntrophales bacterium]|nr:ECF transporter S component [Syntrophales bacterium]